MNDDLIIQKYKAIERMANSNDYECFEPYIRHIRFPLYKRLRKDERIDFFFPITVLVGPNGCNKSSILQALFGCPSMKNVGNFWFSTDVDRIDETTRHCFIHGYKNLFYKQNIEVIKTRIRNPKNPDYWEPSRPILKHGMEPVPEVEAGATLVGRTLTRWDPINKNVVYLDFRQTLPAFDKYFYHSSLKKSETVNTKQDYIRKRSRPLNTVIKSGTAQYTYYDKNRVSGNKKLSEEKCRIINEVLGKNYSSIQIVEHAFYGDQFAKTIVVTDPIIQYSEAVAGSGESSVIILVDEIMDAPERSLILLDEPETSLHPGAQEKLMEFLSTQVIKAKHQLVLATHSPSFLYALPPNAIKVLCETTDGIVIKPESLPEEAFNVIGVSGTETRHIFVEDRLSKYLVDRCIEKKHADLKESIDVQIIAGGADAIIPYYIYPYSQTDARNVLFLLDGDKNFLSHSSDNIELRAKIMNYKDGDKGFNVAKIPMKDNVLLDDIICEITGVRVKCYIDGGYDQNTENQRNEQRRRFLDYWFAHVRFLAGITPEDSIVKNLTTQYKTELWRGDEKDKPDSKMIFFEYAKRDLDKEHVDANDIFQTQKRFVARLGLDCALYQAIDDAILFLFKGNVE